MGYTFRKATEADSSEIWELLKQGILRRKHEGSSQWQDGYPNVQVVQNDIQKGIGYVLTENDKVVVYSAVLINDEPAYEYIEGNWLTNGDFIVVHRVVVADGFLGRGLAGKMLDHIEQLAISLNIHSIKIDTNFDNPAMMKTLDNLGYTYCGEVYFRGNARRAYEKVLKSK